MFRHHSFAQPRLGVPAGIPTTDEEASAPASASPTTTATTPEPAGAIVGAGGSRWKAWPGSAKDRETLRRTVLFNVMELCREEVSAHELRPLVQFLAAFAPAEAGAAEEVLQVGGWVGGGMDEESPASSRCMYVDHGASDRGLTVCVCVQWDQIKSIISET